MPRRLVPHIDRLPIPPDLEATAIGRCCEAWYNAYEKAARQGRGEISCRIRANEAYRAAMPPLTCAENIPGFVACVTHGLVMGTVVDTIATRLIHAAGVVSRACKSSARRSGSRSKAQSQTRSPNAVTSSQDQAPSTEIPDEEGDAQKKILAVKL